MKDSNGSFVAYPVIGTFDLSGLPDMAGFFADSMKRIGIDIGLNP